MEIGGHALQGAAWFRKQSPFSARPQRINIRTQRSNAPTHSHCEGAVSSLIVAPYAVGKVVSFLTRAQANTALIEAAEQYACCINIRYLTCDSHCSCSNAWMTRQVASGTMPGLRRWPPPRRPTGYRRKQSHQTRLEQKGQKNPVPQVTAWFARHYDSERHDITDLRLQFARLVPFVKPKTHSPPERVYLSDQRMKRLRRSRIEHGEATASNEASHKSLKLKPEGDHRLVQPLMDHCPELAIYRRFRSEAIRLLSLQADLTQLEAELRRMSAPDDATADDHVRHTFHPASVRRAMKRIGLACNGTWCSRPERRWRHMLRDIVGGEVGQVLTRCGTRSSSGESRKCGFTATSRREQSPDFAGLGSRFGMRRPDLISSRPRVLHVGRRG